MKKKGMVGALLVSWVVLFVLFQNATTEKKSPYQNMNFIYGVNEALFQQLKANREGKTERYSQFLDLVQKRQRAGKNDIFLLEVSNARSETSEQILAKVKTFKSLFSELPIKPRIYIQLYSSRTFMTFNENKDVLKKLTLDERQYYDSMKIDRSVFSELDGLLIDHEESTYCYVKKGKLPTVKDSTICKLVGSFEHSSDWSTEQLRGLVKMVRAKIPRGSFTIGAQPLGQYLKLRSEATVSYAELQKSAGLELQLIQTQRICNNDPNYPSPETTFTDLRDDFERNGIPKWAWGTQVSMAGISDNTANIDLGSAMKCLREMAKNDIRKVYFYGPTARRLIFLMGLL